MSMTNYVVDTETFSWCQASTSNDCCTYKQPGPNCPNNVFSVLDWDSTYLLEVTELISDALIVLLWDCNVGWSIFCKIFLKYLLLFLLGFLYKFWDIFLTCRHSSRCFVLRCKFRLVTVLFAFEKWKLPQVSATCLVVNHKAWQSAGHCRRPPHPRLHHCSKRRQGTGVRRPGNRMAAKIPLRASVPRANLALASKLGLSVTRANIRTRGFEYFDLS